MKKLLILFLSFISLSLSAQTVVRLKAGAMPVTFKPASNTIYIPDGSGIVSWPFSIMMDGISNITFDGRLNGGYWFVNTSKGIVFNSTKGGNSNISITGFDFGPAAIIVNGDIKPAITYTGVPGTALYNGLYIFDCKVSGGTMLFQGTWDPVTTYHNLVIGMSWQRLKITRNSTNSPKLIFGYSVYQLIATDWDISGPTASDVDVGMIQIQGNCYLANIDRNQGWGYVLREWPVALGGIPGSQETVISNITDQNTAKYGTVDLQFDPTLLKSTAAIPLRGTDVYYISNASAHKKDDGSYVTNAVIQGDFADETGRIFTLHMKNNFAYDAMVSGQSGGSSLYKKNCTKCNLDSAGNTDIPPGVPLPPQYCVKHDTVIITLPPIHDTIPRVCPACPPPVKQRSVKGILYDDNSSQIVN